MALALRVLMRDRFRLGALSPCDVDRGAEIGERMAGAELTARLVEMESDDGHQRRGRERCEKNETSRTAARISGQPAVEVSHCENAEAGAPRHVRHGERIARGEPRAQ